MPPLPLPLSHLFNPRLTSLGRLKARANLRGFPDYAALETGESRWRMSLDGDWRFQLAERPEAAPADWTSSDKTEAPWRDIKVPGVWTRQEMGDLPHYANWQMPFDCQKPPAVPENNPTGLYRTTIDVPEAWQDRSTVLHIGGFESLVLVWCNQIFVGMAKDSRLPSEFDLSEALQPGENELALMVVRWCDATWIEDQDHWNHGGLHRSVWLESRGTTHVGDLVVETDFDPKSHAGRASIRAVVNGDSAGWFVRAFLKDTVNVGVIAEAASLVEQFDSTQPVGGQWAQSYSFQGYAASLGLDLPNASPWSAEIPNRYQLITELLDPGGAVREVHETWIGFTRIETTGRRLTVNGRPVVLIGVNRHDHHPENGKTCCREDIRAELVTMKQHNINAPARAHQYLETLDITDWSATLDLYGGGGLISTPQDMARFWAALYRGEVFENPDTLALMTDAVDHPQKDHYRLGTFIESVGDYSVYSHSGFWGTYAAYSPDLNLAIGAAVLNQSDFGAMRDYVREWIINSEPCAEY